MADDKEIDTSNYDDLSDLDQRAVDYAVRQEAEQANEEGRFGFGLFDAVDLTDMETLQSMREEIATKFSKDGSFREETRTNFADHLRNEAEREAYEAELDVAAIKCFIYHLNKLNEGEQQELSEEELGDLSASCQRFQELRKNPPQR